MFSKDELSLSIKNIIQDANDSSEISRIEGPWPNMFTDIEDGIRNTHDQLSRMSIIFKKILEKKEEALSESSSNDEKCEILMCMYDETREIENARDALILKVNEMATSLERIVDGMEVSAAKTAMHKNLSDIKKAQDIVAQLYITSRSKKSICEKLNTKSLIISNEIDSREKQDKPDIAADILSKIDQKIDQITKEKDYSKLRARAEVLKTLIKESEVRKVEKVIKIQKIVKIEIAAAESQGTKESVLEAIESLGVLKEMCNEVKETEKLNKVDASSLRDALSFADMEIARLSAQ